MPKIILTINFSFLKIIFWVSDIFLQKLESEEYFGLVLKYIVSGYTSYIEIDLHFSLIFFSPGFKRFTEIMHVSKSSGSWSEKFLHTLIILKGYNSITHPNASVFIHVKFLNLISSVCLMYFCRYHLFTAFF